VVSFLTGVGGHDRILNHYKWVWDTLVVFVGCRHFKVYLLRIAAPPKTFTPWKLSTISKRGEAYQHVTKSVAGKSLADSKSIGYKIPASELPDRAAVADAATNPHQ
jgi:hypothetical protein